MSRPPPMPAADAIILHQDDQVATALRPLAAGEVARARTPDGAVDIPVAEPIPICHKLALAAIPAGAPIRKYGEVIGEAKTAIGAGVHVHVHNLASLRARTDS